MVRTESWCDFQASEEGKQSARACSERNVTITHQRCKEHAERKGHIPVTPHEHWVGCAVQVTAPGAYAEVTDRADHVIKAHEVCAPEETEDERAEECADEALDCLLGRQLDEGRATNSDAPDVGKDVVADNEGRGDPEPNETFEDVVHNEVTNAER